MTHVMVVGTEGVLGQTMAEHYRRAWSDVTEVSLAGADDLDTLAARLPGQPIDILVFADNYDAPPRHAVDVKRSELAAAYVRLAIAPFRLANRLKPALTQGSRLVLLSRASASMLHPDPAGRYLDRPFRAAAHQLWRSLSIEWHEAGIAAFIIALDDAATVDASLLKTIDAITPPPKGCLLLDGKGATLAW